MDFDLIWKAVVALSSLGVLFGVLLAIAFSRFRVEMDERGGGGAGASSGFQLRRLRPAGMRSRGRRPW